MAVVGNRLGSGMLLRVEPRGIRGCTECTAASLSCSLCTRR
jgi:hypothetical protein